MSQWKKWKGKSREKKLLFSAFVMKFVSNVMN